MAATQPRRLANLAALNNARNVALAARFESQPANGQVVSEAPEGLAGGQSIIKDTRYQDK
jgi:hypothetical protein